MGSRRIDKEPLMQPRGHKNGQRDNFCVDFEDGNFVFYQNAGVCQGATACEFHRKEDVEKNPQTSSLKLKDGSIRGASLFKRPVLILSVL